MMLPRSIPRLSFTVSVSEQLVEHARTMHRCAMVGEPRNAPGQSFEAYLSELLTVAIIDRRFPVIAHNFPAVLRDGD